MTRRVRLGVLGRPYGLKGGVRLKTEADPEVLAALDRVYLEGRGYRALKALEFVGGEPVLYFLGVGDRTAAEALVGTPVYVEAEALPELPEGTYYYHELIGLPVFLEGEPFGEVADVREAGAQDLLVIRKGLREYLVPLQAPYVEVRREGLFLVAPPAGLFE